MIFALARNALTSRASKRGVVLKDNWGAVLTGDIKGDVVVVNGERHPFSLHIPRVRDPVPDNIGSLLTWRSRIPERLYGRDAEIARLWSWCNEPAAIRVRVLCGEGGAGKTRLAFEFAEMLRAQGWQAGQLVDPTHPVAFPLSKQGALLIIDYPEQFFSAVSVLLRQISNSELPGVRLRVLLLSRNKEAMQLLVNAQIEPFHSAPIELAPLPSPQIAWAIFQDGWQRMAELQQHRQPLGLDERGFISWLQQSPAHAQPLIVLAFALNLLLDPSATKLNRTEILQKLVRRERERLTEEVKKHQLQPEGTLLLKALAAIPGQFSAAQIDALRAQVEHPGIEIPSAVELQRTTLWHDGALHELQPDLLASMLAHLAIRDWLPARDAAGPWVWAALMAGDPSELELRERLRRIARLSADRPGFAEQAHDAIVDALIALISADTGKAKIIDAALAEEAPFGWTLQPLAIWSARQVVRVWEARVLDGFAASAPDLAMSLDNLAKRLADAGDTAACIATLRGATDVREKLAGSDFARYGRDLATTLGTLSVALADHADAAECLAVTRRLVEVWQRLADDDFQRYAPDLAADLSNLAARSRDANDRQAALAATRRAVATYERLVAGEYATYVADLVQSLENLLEACDAEGDRLGTVEAARRIVAIREQQVSEDFAAHAPELATSLRDLWRELAKAGDRVGFLAAIRRAVEIRDQLTERDFGSHAAGLAATLNNLSVHLADLGDRAGSLAALRRAVTIYERLVEIDPRSHTPDLATTLHNLSVLTGRIGSASDQHEGLEALQRAIQIQDALARENFAEHAPALAASLSNLSVELADSGDRAAGLAAIVRVVEIYERLAQASWSLHGADLALSLNTLSTRLHDTGDEQGSLAAARRAIETLELLAAEDFATIAPELVRRLRELALRVDESDALALMARARSIIGSLADADTSLGVVDS